MESLPNTPHISPEKQKMTDQDLQDLEDFQYLLSIMEKQGNVWGTIQQIDIDDAILRKDRLSSFVEGKTPEGSVTVLFDDIIFDFDGVLYDSSHSFYRAIQIMLERHADKLIQAPDNLAEMANSYQAPYQHYYKRFGISLETPEDRAWFKAEYREAMAQANTEHHIPADFYPEVKSVLDKIKDAKKENPRLRVHIISAGENEYIKDALYKYGIADDFDEIHGDCHDKQAMIKAIADKGISDKTVMIGDLPSDLKDAQLVQGVKTIAVARGATEYERLGMYLPDYIVTDLNGVLDLKSYSRELREKEYNIKDKKI